ncbi:hypothetical protein BDZ97DRAFT_1924641 [Flammula alnicola]|nr:hypothetical protein BDZ97DRAFT_1924641 [Flammula alnicola]
MSSCTSGEGVASNSRQTPNIRLHIHPSGLIKSPIVNKLMRRKLTSSDPNQDRLAAEEYKAKRLISLARARRLRVAAEERHGLSELQEFRVLINAAKEGAEFTSLDPQTAIDLARAARDTLAAEEKLEQLKVAECEEQLAILRDSLRQLMHAFRIPTFKLTGSLLYSMIIAFVSTPQ